jgi:AraC-like DNA-binding protein
MIVSGIIGLVLMVSYIFVNVLFERRVIAWEYSAVAPGTMVLWDKVLIIGISLIAIFITRLKAGLQFYRSIITIFIFICVLASLLDDMFNQDLSFASGYLTVILLLATVFIPFKPWQILSICVITILLLYPGLMIMQGIFGHDGLVIPWSQVIYMIIISVILVSSSIIQYHSRYALYVMRKTADGLMDQVFLNKVKEVIEKYIEDNNFGVEWLAHEVAISPRQLQRKLRAITGLSAGGLIRTMRLQRAAQLLEQRAGNVSEVAYKVGFQDTNYFSRIFREMYEISPSQYSKRKKKQIKSADHSIDDS